MSARPPLPARKGPPAFRPAASRGSPGAAILRPGDWEAVAARFALSRREGQIVRAIFDDLTEPAIARTLGISPHTVHTHRERLYLKLAVSSRPQLILLVIQEVLVAGRRPNRGLSPGNQRSYRNG